MQNNIEDILNLKEVSAKITVIGNVFDLDNLERLGEIEICHRFNDARDSFIKTIQGNFLIIINEDDKIKIFNDRFGLKNLYYYFCGGEFLVSSYFGKLAEKIKNKTPDNEAKLEFLLFNYPLGNKTLYKEIKIFPPASIVDIDLKTNRLSVRKYHEFNIRHTSFQDKERILEELIEKLNNSIKLIENTEGSVLLPLSGGLDSRYLAALMKKNNINFEAFTYGKKGCDDQKFATIVSKQLHIPHKHDFMRDTYKFDKYDRIVAKLHGGMYPVDRVYDSGIIDNEGRQEVVVSGLSGDMIFGSRIDNNILRFKSKDRIVQYLFSKDSSGNYIVPKYKSGKYYYFYLFAGSKKVNSLDGYSDNLVEKVYDNYKSELSKYYDVTNISKSVLLFDISNRQRRWIFNIVNTSNKNYVCPFYEYNLFDFVLSIPDKYWLNRDIYVESFIEQFPELAKIPEQKTRIPIDSPNWYKKTNHLKINLFLLFDKILNQKCFLEGWRNH